MQVARRLLLTAIAAGALAAGAIAPVSGQKPVAAPRTANGKVDFSGIWSPDRNFIYDLHDALEKGETLPLQPWAEKLARERLSKSDPEALCLPTGVPRQAPYPWRIVQTGTHMFFLFEGNIHSYRQIFLDGRKHPEDPDPTWYGHSVAHWDGDTLVVDVADFNDQTWFDASGDHHSTALKVVERYTRTGPDVMQYEATMTDPQTFSRPWTIRMDLHRNTDQYPTLLEYECHSYSEDDAVRLGSR